MKKTRVLVVDDSAVLRRAISDLLSGDPEIEVVGNAANGQIALGKIAELQPDVMTLDVEMPVMDGLETLRQMKRAGFTVPVVMCSTLTERGAGATLDALSLGASCYVTKPRTSSSAAESIDNLRRELLPKVKALGHHRQIVTRQKPPLPGLPGRPKPTTPSEKGGAALPSAQPSPAGITDLRTAPRTRPVTEPPPPASQPSKTNPLRGPAGGRATAAAAPKVLVIGVSTGGPNALSTLLPALPENFPVPILVVQHMPPIFTKLVAERINSLSKLKVQEAAEGDLLEPGGVWIAPGDFHMTLQASGDRFKVKLNQDPPENFCRPAVDVLFRSAVAAYGQGILGVILTGMGSDGALGCEAICKAGGQVIVQDAETSVVWGMPGAVVERGLTDTILPIKEIAPEIIRRVGASRKI